MKHLVAGGVDRAVAGQKDQIERGEVTIANFDPLLYAHWGIVNNAVGLVGPSIFMMEDGEHLCPQCYLAKLHDERCEDPENCQQDFEKWTTYAADDAKERWEQLNRREVAQ